MHEGAVACLIEDTLDCLTPWFAVCVRLNWEKAVAARLTAKGYAAFLPLYRNVSRVSGTNKLLPVFPGYVFSSFDVKQRLPILTIPGVHHIVGMGHNPEPLDNHELSAIERFVVSGMKVEPWAFVKTGELVQVDRGPLSGLKGILIETGSSRRLVTSLSLLERSIAVEIDRDDLHPIQATVKRSNATTVAFGAISVRQRDR